MLTSSESYESSESDSHGLTSVDPRYSSSSDPFMSKACHTVSQDVTSMMYWSKGLDKWAEWPAASCRFCLQALPSLLSVTSAAKWLRKWVKKPLLAAVTSLEQSLWPRVTGQNIGPPAILVEWCHILSYDVISLGMSEVRTTVQQPVSQRHVLFCKFKGCSKCCAIHPY